MVLHRVRRTTPAPDGMAILAGGAELAAMEVGVAVRALLSNLRKDLADVTLAASYVLVQASQREFRLGVMVELWRGPNRPPASGSVAALACHGQRTMRIRSPFRTRVLGTHESGDAKKQCRK